MLKKHQLLTKIGFVLQSLQKKLVTINLSILTGLNLTLEVFSQFFFGFCDCTSYCKHSSIKDIIIGLKKLRKNFKVNNALSFEVVTS